MRSQVTFVLGLTLVIAATVAAPAASERRAAAGSLGFDQSFGLISTSVPCPADVPPDTTECRALTVQKTGYPVLGLGLVSESTYTLPLGLGPPTCPANLSKPLATTGRLIVAGKGEIAFALSEGVRCVDPEEAWEEPQEFTITGGTGPFAGASGSGTLVRGELDDYFDVEGYFETWTGTLTVPGLRLTVPKLSGAVSKTVRGPKGAKSARVTFEVTATDDDGADVSVSCWPESGSRFPLGKTMVLCAATDSSGNWVTDFTGNVATAVFTVTVKRPVRK